MNLKRGAEAFEYALGGCHYNGVNLHSIVLSDE